MDAKKRRQSFNDRTSYINGNAALKYNNVPDIRREREQQEIAHPKPRQQRNTKELQSLSLGSLFMLTIAVVATLYICVEYLKLQYNANHMEKTIVSLEQTLSDMKDVNKANYDQINLVYDLDYVYGVAVEEYGMVYPNNNTVITYNSNSNGYVRQFRDIPE
ncbi:MAG TPA: cell division protein FtsL [Clostridiales bacterium]|nr:cell division protein FtsL [Clostridiales bacterium]